MSKRKKPTHAIIIVDPKRIDNYTPFIEPIPALDIETAMTGDLITVCFSRAFIPYINSLLEPLTWDDKIEGTDEQKRHTTGLFEELRYLLTTGNNCMFDPCCPDEIDKLVELVTINNTIVTNLTDIVTNLTTIVNNQVTIIDNSDTTINQNDVQIVNDYIANYNQNVQNNYQTSILNQMIYDGTPQSINQNLTDVWSSDEATRNALCLACQRYMDQVLSDIRFALVLEAGLASAAAAAAIIAGGLLAPFTFGGSAAAGLSIAAGILIGTGTAIMASILNNPEAQREALCCIFDTLKDAELTQATFKTIGNGCTFDDPNGATLADMITQASQSDGNYLAFLRMVGESLGQGNEQNCACDCFDDIELEDFAGTGCIITPMGNCIYRFTQSTPIVEGGVDRYYHSFRDIMSRCLFVEDSPDPTHGTQAVSDHWVLNCDSVEDDFIGGFGGELIQARWRMSPNAQYYKITLAE